MARELSSKGKRVGELSQELEQLQKAKEKLDQLNENLKHQLTSRLPQVCVAGSKSKDEV